MSWHAAIAGADLPESTPTAVEIAGRSVCIVRVGANVHAFDDACPHRQWPLHEGALTGAILRCRAHTWEWNVRTGALQRMRAPECLVTHAVRETEGILEVQIAPSAPAPRELSPLWERVRSREPERHPA